ncbi:pantoate--beta-alanine ligase [Parafrigoribacterium humi]|uniref:pantoate--beta-alanine ligase n=1 Tax=Parafrigoribacterium humi TaxID=3144664 RepID=UPI0032EC07D1
MPVDVVETIAELRARLADARGDGRSIALVPTMGALHDGHLALVARAREIADVVVVSIFVNPLQFGPAEDLDRYPRDLDADRARLDGHGVDLVFAPSVAEMYPNGEVQTRVVAGEVGSLYEGAARPGHFDGVLTVVDKLLGIVGPTVVLFGQKDAQQAFLVKRMVADLNLPVTVETVPIVREARGLALSSRNRYLSEEQRTAALALSAALAAATASAALGAPVALGTARAILDEQPLVKLDYLVAVNPTDFLSVEDDYHGPATVLVAATVGTTRLIDNAAVHLGPPSAVK